ncbi:MAG: hypothetical protein GKS05_11415 [Nitrospirales bacterium]|nr:hypothetical protein [Nitrospirales bacterium]
MKHYRDSCMAAGLLMALMLVGGTMCVGSSYAADKVQATLLVPDVLVFPGKPTSLKARLVRSGVLSHIGLGGENVVFMVGPKTVGTALTGGDGRAFLEYRRHMSGTLDVVVSLEKSPRVEATEQRGVLAVWERRRPILLVDLDALMPVGESSRFSLSTLSLALGGDLPTPIPEAASELEKLARFYYNVIYLARQEGQGVPVIREWLHMHEFPLGLTRTIGPGSTALKAFIDQLKEDGWDNLDAAIGRTLDFAQVLVKDRIRTVILEQPNQKEKFPRRTKLAKTWKTVRKHL